MKVYASILSAVLLAVVSCGGGNQNGNDTGDGNKAEAANQPGDGIKVSDAPKNFSFRMTNAFTVTVPDGAQSLKAWFAMPQRNEPSQTIEGFKVDSPHKHTIVKDQFGNEFVFVEIEQPAAGDFALTETFQITRSEIKVDADPARAQELSPSDREKYGAYLQSGANVAITPEIAAEAKRVVGEEKNPVRASRKLYDWMLANVDYWVKDPTHKKASSVGSSTYTYETRTGNCTDFHSLWVAMARSSGIPSRLVYGSIPKPTLDGTDTDQSYHCWPEFYASGIGWVPHDVAVADLYDDEFPLNDENRDKVELTTALGYKGKDREMVDYYFGNIDERRVTWARGRDHILEGASGPFNAMPKAHVEIDGKPSGAWTRTLTYQGQ